ncbi:MAG: hypothetical protein ACE5KI_01215 [Dehalococcoidia bacterium]
MKHSKEHQKRSNDLWQDQLRIYAEEIAKLYTLLKSESVAWLEIKEHLKSRGANLETLYQMLSAAYTCLNLMVVGDASAQTWEVSAGRLLPILERALRILEEYRKDLEGYGDYDLGLAPLLHQEINALASEHGWEVEVETEPVSLPVISETVAVLSVREALQRAVLNPNTQRVTVAMKPTGNQLVIKVMVYTNGPSSKGSSRKDGTEVLLTPLYVSLIGGSCRWQTGSDSAAGRTAASEMELTLPLEMPRGTERAAKTVEP